MPSQNMTGQTQRGRKQITAYTEQPGASGFASPYRQISRPETELYQCSSMQLRRQGRNRTETTGENTHTHMHTHTEREVAWIQLQQEDTERHGPKATGPSSSGNMKRDRVAITQRMPVFITRHLCAFPGAALSKCGE